MGHNESLMVGDWLVEPELDRITRGNERTRLRHQVMELLVYLAKQEGRVVSADDLLSNLWEGKFVTDNALYNCVAELRQALANDKSEQQYIETIPKRGYRLLAPVTGLDDEHQRGSTQRGQIQPQRIVAASVVGVVLISVTGFYMWAEWAGDGLDPPSAAVEFEPLTNSVAVLAFEDLSADSSYEYLADGISEILIHQLSQVRDLRVIARTSSFAFKGGKTDIREIGRRLHVEFVLEGSVQSNDGTLRITAQLVDARSGTHIWSKLFDRDEASLFDIQDEIALAAANEILDSIIDSGEDRTQFARQGTANPEALDFFLRGRFHFNQMTAASHRKAQDYYQQALQQDPDYAAAYAALAESLQFSMQFETISKIVLRPKIMAMLDKAIELDDGLAEAWAILGLTRFELFDDWAGSLEALERAYKINPNNLEVNNYLRQYYAVVGPAKKMIPHAETAVQLDPLGTFTSAQLAFAYNSLRQYDKALEASEATLALEPNFSLIFMLRSLIFNTLGRYPEALQAIDKSIELRGSDDASDSMPFRAHILARLGRVDEAEAILDQLQSRSTEHYVSPMYFAIIFEGLGRYDESLTWLEKAYEQEDWILHWFVREAMFDSVRDTLRFKAIMQGLGLEDEGYLDEAQPAALRK